MDYGIICLLPPLIVVLSGFFLRRAFEPLLIGCLIGYAIIAYYNRGVGTEVFQANLHQFPTNFIHGLKQSLMAEDMVWIILVCGVFGGLIELIIRSGGVFAFGEWAMTFVKNERSALIVSWLVGLLIFIDDYMSALANGVTVRKITDKFGISRVKLAFIVSAMAAPLCLIFPMTTWTIYCGKLLEDNAVVGKSQGFDGYLATIPFMFYPIIVVLMSLLMALGYLPLTQKYQLKGNQNTTIDSDEKQESLTKKSHPMYFFLPLIVMIAATFYLNKDALYGGFAALAFTFFLYLGTRVMTMGEFSDAVFAGLGSMIYALGILVMSYVLKRVGDEMKLTPFVIEIATPYLNKAILPMLVFLVLSFISYSTASSWGLYAVAIPIVFPLAQAVGANVWLSMAAVFSCGGFGSQASFFSDATILTAQSTETDNMEISFAALPYNLFAVALSALAFWIAGMML